LALLDHLPNARDETVTTTGWLLVAIIVLLAPIAIAALLYVARKSGNVHHRPIMKSPTSSLHKTGDGRAKNRTVEL
jgi:hypothetical protein